MFMVRRLLPLFLALVSVHCQTAKTTRASSSGKSTGAAAGPGQPAPVIAKYAGAPGAGVKFFHFPAQNNRTDPTWGPVMTDVIQHLPESYGTTYFDSDRIDYVRETSHGIHAHLRGKFNSTGQRANAFYFMGHKATLVIEPKILKSQAAEFVPLSLRGPRFGLYISGQSAWENAPLYVWDEWNAQINAGAAAIDLAKKRLWTGENRDAVEGIIEFTTYSLAVAMAVQKYDPAYFHDYAQFTETLAFNLERGMKVFFEGAQMLPFKRASQEALYNRLKDSPEGEGMRQFARQLFGPAWANRVLYSGIPVQDPTGDTDGDGVKNLQDRCSGTAKWADVWRTGDWAGCGEGQNRDR